MGQEKWNPRYEAFARVHGRTPEAQGEHDAERWPGGSMAGFMGWISEQWAAWWEKRKTEPGAPRSYRAHVKGDDDHASFDARLAALGPCAGCVACSEKAAA